MDSKWFVYRIPHLSLTARDWFVESGLEPYLPTQKVRIPHPRLRGKTIEVERPRLLNYVLAKGTEKEVEEMRKKRSITPIYQHKEKGVIRRTEFLTVPDVQMERFMKIMEMTTGETTLFDTRGMELEKGDKVCVVGGPFDGFVGTLVTEQGKNGGRVVMNIDTDSAVGIMTAAVPSNNIQVIEFATGTTHFYKQIQAIEKRIAEYEKTTNEKEEEDTSEKGGKSKEAIRQQLELFLWRFEKLKETQTTNIIKLLVSRYRIYQILGNTYEAEQVEAEIKQKLNNTSFPETSRKYIENHTNIK